VLDNNWLRTFATLARLQHFGRTAVELHMTQPNVSLHIKQLEQATATQLLERSPFCLTRAGERLLVSAETVLGELQLCQADLRGMSDLSQGQLTIAASDTVARYLLLSPLQSFAKKYPGIDLRILNTTSAKAAELVKDAAVDVGFVMAPKPAPSLFYSELLAVPWCAVGGELGDSASTLILLGHDTRSRELIEPTLVRLGLADWRVMEVSSVAAQLDWAQAGFGVAIVPQLSLQGRPALQQSPQVDIPAAGLGYVLRQNQILSAASKQLLAWIAADIEKLLAAAAN